MTVARSFDVVVIFSLSLYFVTSLWLWFCNEMKDFLDIHLVCCGWLFCIQKRFSIAFCKSVHNKRITLWSNEHIHDAHTSKHTNNTCTHLYYIQLSTHANTYYANTGIQPQHHTAVKIIALSCNTVSYIRILSYLFISTDSTLKAGKFKC